MKAIDDMVEDRLMLCEDVEAEMARLIQAGLDAGVPAPKNGDPPVHVPRECSKDEHEPGTGTGRSTALGLTTGGAGGRSGCTARRRAAAAYSPWR